MKIRKEDLQDLYPLTRMQEGMLFHALNEPSSPAYIEQVTWRVRGPLDKARYSQAWDRLHARYEVLRSVFTHEKTREPLQMVLKQRDADVEWTTDLQGLPATEQHARLREARQRERAQGFDLASGPLLRVRAHQLADDDAEICITWHHILLDGWSTHLMLRDLLALYEAPDCAQASLPPLPPYASYIEWLKRQDTPASLAWWKSLLHGYEDVAHIPAAEPAAGTGLRKLDIQLDPAAQQRLQGLATQLDATASSLMQAVWGLVLGRWVDRRDVVFGTVVSGRSPEVPGIENLPGLLINTVPVRVRFDDAALSFSDLVRAVHRQALDAQPHHACRLADIQNTTAQRAELIQHLLVFENYPIGTAQAGNGGLSLEVVETCEPTSYGLLVVVDPSQGSQGNLRIEFQYHAEAYAESQVQRLAGHFRQLLLSALEAPDRRVAELDLLTGAERKLLVHDLNATTRDYPRDETLARRFAQRVQRHGGEPALASPEGSLSYAQLDERAGRLAGFMRQKGVQAGDRVAVLLDRSPALIETLLAIARLGASYVALDPTDPVERIRFALSDSGACAAVARATASLPLEGVIRIHPDADAQAIAACAVETPNGHDTEEACVFYTSGSTGTPKAVRVGRRGLLRLVCDTDYIDLGPGDRIAQISHVGFDAASFEIWGSLLNGAAVHIIPRETVLTPPALARALREQSITTLFLTTALFNQMAREVPNAFATLTQVLTGGEKVHPAAMRRVLEHGAPKRLLHVYGPTEVTTFSTWHLVTAADDDATAQTIPIGRPIANTTAYVVSQDLRLQPLGAPGELLLGGDGVALGYLNRPELTAERFIDDPFQTEGSAGPSQASLLPSRNRPGAAQTLGRTERKLYRTGDIVCRRPNGDIEFIGRRDGQIKLRGFRIEPGEIEARLREFKHVQEALVMVRQDEGSDQRKLVAYLGMGAAPAAHVDIALRSFLKERLPDYMIPSSFVILDKLPVNVNGKIDRQALPVPSRSGTGFGKTFIAPMGKLEEQLASIWATVLGTANIGRQDNFFELGGHSLTATTALAHIRAMLQVEVPLPFFFQCPNLQALAEEVEKLKQTAPVKAASGITRVSRERSERPAT